MSSSRLFLSSLLLTCLVAVGCSSSGTAEEPAATAAASSPTVAEVNGRVVTLEELDARLLGELYDLRSEALEGWLREIVKGVARLLYK